MFRVLTAVVRWASPSSPMAGSSLVAPHPAHCVSNCIPLSSLLRCMLRLQPRPICLSAACLLGCGLQHLRLKIAVHDQTPDVDGVRSADAHRGCIKEGRIFQDGLFEFLRSV